MRLSPEQAAYIGRLAALGAVHLGDQDEDGAIFVASLPLEGEGGEWVFPSGAIQPASRVWGHPGGDAA